MPEKQCLTSPKEQRLSLSACIDKKLADLGLGLQAKLIIIFTIIKIVPLVLLAGLAWMHAAGLGDEMKLRTSEISNKAVEALTNNGEIASRDAVEALDHRATAEIERMSTDAARAVAEFLYARDTDIRLAATLPADPEAYRSFLQQKVGRVVRPGRWDLSQDGKSWERVNEPRKSADVSSSLDENNHSFHYVPPVPFDLMRRPLYLEMTFIGLDGMERVKVTTSPQMSSECKNVAEKSNTYVKAETYFAALQKLKADEIYVSDVIGAYVGTNYIGMYTPKNLDERGLEYAPTKQAYAGKENPNGIRFKGLVRWGLPVVRDGVKVGYVTLALDHDHIMEFVDRLSPLLDRYTELPDAYEGNYAFIWDYKGRSICHPRHHSIAGYDPDTGNPQIPWLEESIYQQWKASGKEYVDFIEDVPTFFEQSNRKRPAAELTKQGLVGLDCRYLNFAPQCTGWFDLTEYGGSGSFRIFWSGLWKLNTAAAIPYYTGQYGLSRRGFGFVAVGANLGSFHQPALDTRTALQKLVANTQEELNSLAEGTYQAIYTSLRNTATSLSLSTLVMIALVLFIAVWMAGTIVRRITALCAGIRRFQAGERHFRFNSPVKDEMGQLSDAFDSLANTIVATDAGPLSIVDLSGKLVYVNEPGLELVGKDLKDIIGKPYAENTIFPPGTKYSPLDCFLLGTKADILWHEPSGRYYSSRAEKQRDFDGTVTGYVIHANDVTELVLEQKRIEQQRAMLNTLFSNSPDIIWYQDRAGVYQAANERFCAMVGKSADDICGKASKEFTLQKLAKILDEMFDTVMHSGESLVSEELLEFADGHTETVEVVRIPARDKRGVIQGMIGVARDVSRRVAQEKHLLQVQNALEIAVEDASKANAAKSSFLARMSHEIRTPINAIIGIVSIAQKKMQAGEPVEVVMEHAGELEGAARHLLGLINDILDISKIEANKLELVEDIFNLGELINTVTMIIRPRCVDKKINFVVAIEGESEHLLIGDALRLRQVLINLLGNAAKFTPEYGEVQLRIKEEKRVDNKLDISFVIQDTGIGISEEQRKHLFKPFEQGGAHIAHTYGGTGLGLSISSKLIEMMGSRIEVESTMGKGSTFSFTLSFTESDEPVLAHQEHWGDKNNDDVGKRILLVDDVVINRLIVTELLNEMQLLIDEADDGQKAVTMFADSPEGYYNLILMDIQMPVMDGLEATRCIRAMDRADAKSVPIIALSANAFKEDVERVLSNGMNAHLAKPLEPSALVHTLHLWLSVSCDYDAAAHLQAVSNANTEV